MKGVSKMEKIIIVVENGIVQEVLSKNELLDIELLDLDDTDIESLESKKKRYEELSCCKTYKDIL